MYTGRDQADNALRTARLRGAGPLWGCPLEPAPAGSRRSWFESRLERANQNAWKAMMESKPLGASQLARGRGRPPKDPAEGMRRNCTFRLPDNTRDKLLLAAVASNQSGVWRQARTTVRA